MGPSQIPLPDNTQHSQETTMLPAGFEPIILASDLPQTHALDPATAETGLIIFVEEFNHGSCQNGQLCEDR
jgi:hypothetical protein